ncbi:HD-GYP domain-containing protein [Luteimonas aestuarii]|nr:HD-GYP domain-containing protein [Luteimonas aestuarii]
MQIEERRVEVDQLRAGMFVCRLDRDWVGTPFLLQGFLVEGEGEIEQLKRCCRHVFIDVEKSVDVDEGLLASGPAGAGAPSNTARPRVDVLAAVPHAASALERATAGVAEIYSILREGGRIDRRVADAVVQPIMGSLARHPDAFFWLQALRKHDDYAYGHAVNCSALSVALGRELGLEESELADIAAGCLLMDIGMIHVPAEILAHGGPLPADQRHIVREHVQTSAALYAASGLHDVAVLEIIQGHHERHDGSGYPAGTVGTEIPLHCRIAGLVDSYDAMISDRPYRRAISRHDALQQLYRQCGHGFQAELVEKFMQCMGIYPVGSLVELDSGEVAVVMAQNRVRRLRPTLMLLTDASKALRDQFIPVDLMLADRKALPESRLKIIRGLEPGAYGLDPRELYL